MPQQLLAVVSALLHSVESRFGPQLMLLRVHTPPVPHDDYPMWQLRVMQQHALRAADARLHRLQGCLKMATQCSYVLPPTHASMRQM
jgi:hypothetical protein